MSTRTSDTTPDRSDDCNVCGGDDTDHHLCVATESVLGADVWVYKDGYARVVPWFTRHERLAQEDYV